MDKAPYVDSVHFLLTLLCEDLFLVSWTLACTSYVYDAQQVCAISSTRIVPEQFTNYCS